MIRRKFLEELPRELAKAKRFPWCILRYCNIRNFATYQMLWYLDQLMHKIVRHDTADEWKALQSKILETMERVAELDDIHLIMALTRADKKQQREYYDEAMRVLSYYAD